MSRGFAILSQVETQFWRPCCNLQNQMKNKAVNSYKIILQAFLVSVFLTIVFKNFAQAQPKAQIQIEPSAWLKISPERSESFQVTVPSAGFLELILSSEFGVNSSDSPRNDLRIELDCDSEVRIIQGSKQKLIQRGDLSIYNSAENSRRTFLNLQKSDNQCQIKYDSNTYLILPESQLYKAISNLRENQSLSSDGKSILNPRILKNPYASLSARFKALFGRDLSWTEYLDKNPNMTIDLSRAPKLDLIVLDTLQIVNDFVGRTMMRGLEFHAERGTKIYFMTSKNLIFQKDGQMIENFKFKFPSAHINIYEKKPDHFDIKGAYANIHRTNHVKVMLTYSEKQPEYNSFIAGGRNLSEQYFYTQKPDNKKYNDIVQWDSDQGYGWVYFDDLDFEIKNNDQFKNLTLNLLNFNEQQFELNQKNQIKLNQNGSHIYSNPFGDSKNILEKNYIELLQNARKSIFIISPYLNLTTKIKNALDQAKSRGIDIQIYTNLIVEGDFMPFIMQPAVYRSVRQIINDYQIHFYQNPISILHVKSVLIDDQNLILGSVNLNQRSFIHDTEFSMLLNEKSVITDFKNQIKTDVLPFMKKISADELPPKTLMEFLVKPLMSVM